MKLFFTLINGAENMEISLTTVRYTHRALMLVAATTLFFAVSFQISAEYGTAHEELEMITNMYPYQYGGPNCDPNWRRERALISKDSLEELIKSVAEELGIEVYLNQLDYRQIQPPWMSGPRFYGTLAELQADFQNQQVF
jgi:hypothetical protein